MADVHRSREEIAVLAEFVEAVECVRVIAAEPEGAGPVGEEGRLVVMEWLAWAQERARWLLGVTA